MPSLLHADDIYDTRESAMTAMRQSKAILGETKKLVTAITSSSGSITEPGRSMVRQLGKTVTPALQQLTDNITKVVDSMENAQQTVNDVSQVTDAAKKITDRYSSGMKNINSKLQDIQSGASNISLPKADQDSLAKIKTQITESLNSAGAVSPESAGSTQK